MLAAAYCRVKKVALNFPPLEQGPAGKLGRRHLLLALNPLPVGPGETLENSERVPASRIQKTQKPFPEEIVKINSLQDLYVDELRDLYDAENQLIKALPKMAEESTSDELRQGFEEHLEQTRGHAQRLEQIFESLGEKAKGKKCKGMEGIIKEGSEVLEEDMQEDTKDAAIIGAAQRVEHYEIAGYGTARTHAELLGRDEDVTLLEETLEEEKETDEKLTGLAENINVQAEEGEGTGAGTRSTARRSTTKRKSAA